VSASDAQAVATSSSGAARNADYLAETTNVRSVEAQGPRERTSMGKVLAAIKIFPSDVSKDLSQLKDQIQRNLPKDVSVLRFQEEPIAFGLVALIATLSMPEEISGKMDEIEDKLKATEGVSEIQVITVSRA
jgi:elongation factor 1-beta